MPYLFSLTKSSLRAKLLLYYFSNPEAGLYVREMAQILHVDATNLSKELSRLEKAGVFVSKMRGNQKHYSINTAYPLYSELRSIVFKTIGVEGGLRSILERLEGISCAFIYGSFAEGKERAESDIDLLIIGKPDEDKLIEMIGAFEKEVGREVNYNIYLPEEFKRRLEGKDSFIVNVVKRKKIMLRGDINGI
ncbi:MAG: nucleotidyltransferase domain-containing protein [Candidatus Omnitrophota bacterium]